MSGARLWVAAVGCVLCACKGAARERPAELDTPPAEQVQPERAVPTSPIEAPAPAEESPPPTAAQLPVAEDFQAETAKAIVRANYRSELDALEGELRADSP